MVMVRAEDGDRIQKGQSRQKRQDTRTDPSMARADSGDAWRYHGFFGITVLGCSLKTHSHYAT